MARKAPLLRLLRNSRRYRGRHDSDIDSQSYHPSIFAPDSYLLTQVKVKNKLVQIGDYRMFPQNGLKGQQAISPGQRLGYDDRVIVVPERLRVGELCSGMRAKALDGGDASYLFFCPFRAVAVYSCLPRAMPWAMCLLPLRGVVEHTKSYQVIFFIITKTKVSQLSTLNAQHSTLNSQLSTLNKEWILKHTATGACS